jgi:hypothetical protein
MNPDVCGRICSRQIYSPRICNPRGHGDQTPCVGDVGNFHHTSRTCPLGGGVGALHGGGFVEAGEVTSRNRKNTMAVCGVDEVEILEVGLLVVVPLVPVAEGVGRHPVLAVVEAAPHPRRTCSYEDGDGLLGGCHGTRGSLAGCLFQAPILACRSRSCRRRMSSQMAAPWAEAGAARAVSRGVP